MTIALDHVPHAIRPRIEENIARLATALARPDPVSVLPIPGKGRIALLYDAVGFGRLDRSRLVFPVRQTFEGKVQRIDSWPDLMQPLQRNVLFWALLARHAPPIENDRQLLVRARIRRGCDQAVANGAWRVFRSRLREPCTVYWPEALGLDPELVAIAMRSRTAATRRTLSTREFTLVWKNEAAFRQVARENPRLLPLLSAFAQSFKDGKLPEGRDPVAALKERLLAARLTQATWRYLTRHGCRMLREAWRIQEEWGYAPMGQAIAYLRCLQAAGLPPPPSPLIARNLAMHEGADPAGIFGGPDEQLHSNLSPRALFLMLRDADQRRCDTNDYRELVQEIFDYREFGQPWMLEGRIRWGTVVGRIRRDIERGAVGNSRNATWRVTFPALEFDGLVAMPIDSAFGLSEETLRMHNCIETYAENCRLGLVQVVSFRDARTQKSVANAAYARQPMSRREVWRLVEVKEVANRAPDSRISRLARAVEDVLNVIELSRRKPR